jgi:hypothetical protein
MVGLFGVRLVLLLLQSLQEFEQCLLRDFAPSSSEFGVVGEPESGIQAVRLRLEQ